MEIAIDRRTIGWLDDLAQIKILVGAADAQARYDFLPVVAYPATTTGDRMPDPPGTAFSLSASAFGGTLASANIASPIYRAWNNNSVRSCGAQ